VRALEVDTTATAFGILPGIVFDVILGSVADLLPVQANLSVAVCAPNIARWHRSIELRNLNVLPVQNFLAVPLV
jgi:hypothetical protein